MDNERRICKSTLLLDVFYGIIRRVCVHLESNAAWRQLLAVIPKQNNITEEKIDDEVRKGLADNRSEALLYLLATKEYDVDSLLWLLDAAALEQPSIALGRKFHPVEVLERLTVTYDVEHKKIRLACKVAGFPFPKFDWYLDDACFDRTNTSVVHVPRCHKHALGRYKCIARNKCTMAGQLSAGKPSTTAMELTIEAKDLDAHQLQHCDLCNDKASTAAPYTATDKVALVIGNSNYENLKLLHTPAYDAETLAAVLMKQGFKTVCLCDLRIEEMRFILREYCRLLGSGVYAVFYFVGHGFELNGQCYLLPIEAPAGQYECSDCLCAEEEVLAMMQECNPALNVILLDMCRRLPQNSEQFMSSKSKSRPYLYNSGSSLSGRNTVFGYATTFAEGAYEVKGERNGIFMKYFKEYASSDKPILNVLHQVAQEVAADPLANMQYPEVRTTLSEIHRSLNDPLCWRDHTHTFCMRTAHWQQLHKLPDPLFVPFPEIGIEVVIYYDYYGHFSNMVYLFARVDGIGESMEKKNDIFLAYLKISGPLSCKFEVVRKEERNLTRTTVSNLQNLHNALLADIELLDAEQKLIVARKQCKLADTVMISYLNQMAPR